MPIILKRKYNPVRLQGRDRPYRAPGRLIHALEINEDGVPYAPGMAICGRTPREDSEGFMGVVTERITCLRCRERMR